jgi:hypothetical protein
MGGDQEDGSVVRADRSARTIALAVFAVATIAGMVLMRWMTRRIADLEGLMAVDMELAREGTVRLLWSLTGLGTGLAVVAAIVLALRSHAILRAGRYPVPGARPLRDTRVRTGVDARRIAALGYAAAGGLLLGAVGLLVTVKLTIEALATR